MRSIALCDVGLGNLRSVEKALERVGGRVLRTSDPEVVRRADQVVVPGQGAFRDCMAALKGGLGDALVETIRAGKPYLGICLGLQILFDESEEHGLTRGLGLLRGRVVRFPADMRDSDGRPLKVPHMGWNAVAIVRPAPLLAGQSAAPYFYFVHSYYPVPADPGVVAARCRHGIEITAAVAHENVFACQFHPEKSQQAGLRLLEAFVTCS
jgi:glutamine amidotransferase